MARFPRVSREQIDDALSAAIADLFDYWVHLPSSIKADDPRQTFTRAVKRATWRAQDYLGSDTRRVDRQESLDDADCEGPGNHRLHEDVPTPEDTVVSLDERRRVLEVLANLDEEEHTLWLTDFLHGRTVTEVADEQGVAKSTITRRRESGVARAVAACHEAGVG